NAIKSESIITADAYKQNEFDKWLELNYILPYNIQFKYRYEEIESDFNHYTVPADMENSIVMAHLVKYLCIETYNEVAGVDFTRSYFPKEFFLIGEFEYENNGTMILGTAEGGRKILLAGINQLTDEVLANPEALNHYYIKTIHHEFTHILNQVRNYPTSYKEVNGSKYVNDSWSEKPFNTAYLKRGFISAYSQKEAGEDIAEMLSEYVTHSPEWWEKQMKDADALWEDDPDQTVKGRVLIEQKLDILRGYLFDVFGMDIDDIRDAVNRRQNDVAAGKVNLTSINL
ncbi:MAG: putative zinc-binding metallopeptidase, partial [Bacteroidales bacterium]|nr:putative zinc-binding metallopeptidase [Bacteroidales bacterium]